jgi:hypothetical protein
MGVVSLQYDTGNNLLGIIVPFTAKKAVEPFPNYWPNYHFQSVSHGIFRNQPPGTSEVYTFAVKPDVGGHVFSLILQANKTVMYKSNNPAGKDEGFNRWVAIQDSSLRKLAETFNGTIVGKIREFEKREYFCAYYVIKEEEVYLDERSIVRLVTGGDDSIFNGRFIATPVVKIVSLDINRVDGRLNTSDFGGITSPAVAFPVTKQEARTSEEDHVAAPARLLASVHHMNFMAMTI